MHVLRNTLKSLGVTTLPKAQPKEKVFNLDTNETVYQLQELSRKFAGAYEVSPEQALGFLYLAAEQNISQLIRDGKITETQLARACGCDVKTLRGRIYNSMYLTAIELRAVCSELDMTLNELTDSSVFLISFQ